MDQSKIDPYEVVQRLRDLRYSGPFPGGIEVLLVPFSSAFLEIQSLYPEITKVQLRRVLKNREIIEFKDSGEWLKFKTKIKK